MRRTLTMIALLAATGALAAGCGGGSSSSSGGLYGGGQSTTSGGGGATATGTAVTINNFAFSPATLNVKVGQQVTWTNQQQGVAHTVTADQGAFDHAMPSAATFSFTFTTAGSFAYHCKIHPSMHGTVVVS